MNLCRRLRFPAQSQFPSVLVQDSPAAATHPPEQAQYPNPSQISNRKNPKKPQTHKGPRVRINQTHTALNPTPKHSQRVETHKESNQSRRKDLRTRCNVG
ncbi:hypothetical protein MIMGU_mgv1a016958mg [Erythranthe guttata]|uniref:Uncharacterized protein n=1 Tax=Erythranthe guttata TaxID=4155 RepID=A0A022PZ31_ERYGU|nr:hypothetical protein MIMGU_mgv1a016958mg [Erythranthe guttata]